MEPTATKKELSHQRIVDAAARAIRRGGFSGVGVVEVMKEAGLTHGGFYAHFGLARRCWPKPWPAPDKTVQLG